MKALIISVNTETRPYPVYPLGVDYVAGAIAHEHQVFILDMNEFNDISSLEQHILKINPDIIGLSIRNVDNTDVLEPREFIGKYRDLVNAIRKVTDVLIVLGGSGFTIFPQIILKTIGADYGIIGEGERFAGFLAKLEKKEDVSTLPGVIGIDTPETIPAPWSDTFHRSFNPNAPHLRYYLKRGGMLNLQTKRGCNFNCIYCTYPHIEGKKLRLINPHEVAQTAKMLEDAGARYLFITDSAFNSDNSHSKAVALEFQKAKLSIPWGAFMAPIRPPKKYYRILADAGMTHIEFGTDSLSDKILVACRKPFRCEDVFNAHGEANDAGLHISHFYLFGAPAESRDTITETLLNAEKLERTVHFLFAGMRIYPYTALYDIAQRSGQIMNKQNLINPQFFSPHSVSLNEIEQILKEHTVDKLNWVLGAGGKETAKIISKMHARGHAGPLWEFLIK